MPTPNQRQQIAKQIEEKNRQLGNIKQKNQKFFTYGSEEITNVPQNPPGDIELPDVIRWRKRWFIEQKPIPYYTPNEIDFINYIANGNEISTTYIQTIGSLKDTNILQYTVAVYDIEIFRNSATNIIVPINCNKSVMIEVNNNVVFDSGENGPNDRTSVSIDIPGKSWTKIEIYYYTHSDRVEENYIIFGGAPFINAIDKSRIPVPESPNSLTATQGTVLNSVNIDWAVRNQAQYEFFQLYYGEDSSATNVLASNIPSNLNPLQYTHIGITGSTHYYYKVRGVTSEGEATSFTSSVEGWAQIAADTNPTINLELSFLPNSITDLQGYYADSTVTAKVFSTRGALDTPSNLTLTVSSFDMYETTGVFISQDTYGNNYFTIDNTQIGSGYVYVVATYDDGSQFAMSSGTYIYDTKIPIFEFTVSADTYHEDDDLETWTRSREVFIFTTSGFDAPYTNETTAGIYQVKFAESILNLDNADWIEWTSSVPLQFILSAETGYKTVYGIARDRAGNTIATGNAHSDSIYYATGTIQPVVTDYIATSYSFLDIYWNKPDRGDIQGYEVWRTRTDYDPDVGSQYDTPILVKTLYDPLATSYRDYWNGRDINENVIFPFSLGDLSQELEYFYWIRAFTYDGRLSNYYSMSGFVGVLDYTPPFDDNTGASGQPTGTENGQIWVRFRGNTNEPNTTFSEGSAFYHDIYRLDLTEFPGEEDIITNAVYINTYPKAEEDTLRRFWVYDTPPHGDHYYQYFSVARNFWGYTQTGTTSNPPGTGIRLNDGPPSNPLWDTGNVIARWWGVRLALQQPSETDIVSYDIYIQTGSWASDPNSDVAFTFNYDSKYATSQPFFPRISPDQLPDTTGLNTFWAVARDIDGLLSNYSTPLITGISVDSPPKPYFVRNECYSWFGYNQLVFTGASYNEGILQGYRIYRNTGNNFSLAEQIGTVLDPNNDGGIKLRYADSKLNYYTPYYYWVTAFNSFDIEGTESDVLYLSSGAEPIYGELFPNYLDNSSFERPLDGANNWSGTVSTTQAFNGIKSALVDSTHPLFYSGLIHAKQTKNYMLSLYRWFYYTPNTRSLSGLITFYTPGRESVLATSSFSFSNIDAGFVASSWQRVTFGPFTPPNGTTNAEIKFSSANSDDWYVDAIQWEEYSGGISPRPYVDSRSFSAERIQANAIITDMLDARAVTAEKIGFGEISGGHIVVGSIELDKLETLPGDNRATPEFGFDLISSGVHTVYISGGTLHVGSNSYNVTGVYTSLVAVPHVGRLFGPVYNDNLPYYFYYNNTTNSGELIVHNNLSSILSDSNNKLVWKFTNSTIELDDNDVYENAGYFHFNGEYFGPGVQINGNDITAGSINGQIIKSKTITTDKLIVGHVGNKAENTSFEFANSFSLSDTVTGLTTRVVGSWRFYNGSTEVNTNSFVPAFGVTSPSKTVGNILYQTTQVSKFGSNAVRLASRTTGDPSISVASNMILIQTGVQYSMSTYYLFGDVTDSEPGGSFFVMALKMFDENQALVDDYAQIIDAYDGTEWVIDYEDAGWGPGAHFKEKVYVTGSNKDQWLRTGYDFIVTGSTVKYVQVSLETWNSKTTTNIPLMYMDGINFYDSDRPWNSLEYFPNGGVLIDEGRIEADSINASHIKSLVVDTQHLVAEAVTTDKIEAGAITTSKLTVRSDNMFNNPNFRRWDSETQYFVRTGGFLDGRSDALDGWTFRITNVGNVNIAYRQDLDVYKWNGWSLQVSGTVVTGVNTYIDIRGTEENGRWPLPVESGKTYTFGAWIYKHAGSSDFSFDSNIFVYDNTETVVHQYSASTAIDSTYNSTWKYITQEFTITGSTTNRHGRFRMLPTRTTYSPYLKFNIGGVGMVEGSNINSGYLSEAETIIRPGYIKTGRLDADIISIESAAGSVTINSGGIRIGSETNYSVLNDTDLKFYTNGNESKYLKRLDVYSSKSPFTLIPFNSPFLEAPALMINPRYLQTYSTTLGSSTEQYLQVYASTTTTGCYIYTYLQGSSPVVSSFTTNMLNNYDTSQISYGDTYVVAGNIVTGLTTSWISENNGGTISPFATGNTLSMGTRVTIWNLDEFGDRYTDRQSVTLTIQFIYGRVTSTNIMVVSGVQDFEYKYPYTYLPITYPIIIDKEVSFQGLTSNIRWGFQMRVFEKDNGNQAYIGAYATAINSGTVATYTNNVGTQVALTDSIIDIIAIERG